MKPNNESQVDSQGIRVLKIGGVEQPKSLTKLVEALAAIGFRR
jgi:hypothetical protein